MFVFVDYLCEEGGVKVFCLFRREFIVFEGVDYKYIKCVCDLKGYVVIMVFMVDKK